LLGQHIGAYRVARLLGVGGMGRVYKGVHPAIGSRVAIKVLSHDCVQNPELVERFFAEARAVNLIRHENIVNVLDLATLSDGRPYIIMEYLDGAPLTDVITGHQPMPLGSFAWLIGEVLDALSAAHGKGIVHRDLKPDNVFVTPQGRARVLDFGIAKLMPELSGRTGPTRTGSLLGTPHYMAPEQAMAHAVDARTDVYAIGVILFEGVTGQRPFAGESLFELLHKHVNEPPPAPASLRPDVPPDYAAVILRALAKDPAQRFQSVVELAQALKYATQSLPQHAWAAITPGGAAGARAMGTLPMPTPLSTPAPMSLSAPTPAPGMSTPMPGGQARPVRAAAPGTTASGQVQPAAMHAARSGRGAWWILGLAALAIAGIGVSVVALGSGEPGREFGGEPGGEPGGETFDPFATGSAAAAGAELDAELDAESLEQALADLENMAPAERIAAAQKLAERARADADKQTREAMARANEQVQAALEQVQALSGEGAGSGDFVEFDLEQFDVTDFMGAALARARAHYEDAVLVRIDAGGVYPDGLADLTLDDSFSVLYRFNSPSRAKRPADLPVGVKYKPNCKFYVLVNAEGVRPYPVDGWDCDEPPIGEPKCTVKEVWKRAIAKGAPSNNAVAEIGYRAWQGKARWYISVGDDFSRTLADSCK
jgi:hypothetical protein